MRILVTRPPVEAEGTARRLRALGHEPLITPVMRIVPLGIDLTGLAADAVALTSAHAAEFLAAKDVAALSALPAFAVGARSAEAARRAGFRDVRAGSGDEAALAPYIASALPGGAQVLYLAGRERKGDLPGLLHGQGLVCTVLETYDSVAATALDAQAVAALAAGKLDAVLHYSARSAALLLELADAAGVAAGLSELLHLCLSAAVAARLSQLRPGHVRVAARPDEPALFELLPPLRGEASPSA